MEKFRTACRRFVYRCRQEYLTLPNVITAFLILLGGFFVYGAIDATAGNWSLQTKLSKLEIKAEKLKLEVEKLQLEQEYYLTDEYRELMAREKLGKKAEGETMLILPPNSQSAKQKDAAQNAPLYYRESNFSEWLDFLFGNP